MSIQSIIDFAIKNGKSNIKNVSDMGVDKYSKLGYDLVKKEYFLNYTNLPRWLFIQMEKAGAEKNGSKRKVDFNGWTIIAETSPFKSDTSGKVMISNWSECINIMKSRI